MIRRILNELRAHLPFTLGGAATGLVLMLGVRCLKVEMLESVFYVLHPLHVVLSALVTASMLRLHRCPAVNRNCLRGGCNLPLLLIVGFAGSVGIATLSDSIIPFLGEIIMDLPRRKAHIGFIERPWLVNPLAAAGIAMACIRPATRFPHAGHVLISTWASSFHMLMASEGIPLFAVAIPAFVFLSLSVWVPCCVSDIVFPLLFARRGERTGGHENPWKEHIPRGGLP